MFSQMYFTNYTGVLLLLFFNELLFGQVNTEKLRNLEAKKGFQNTAGFGFGYLAGNSDQYRVAANYRLDWLTAKYYSFFIANYERGESGGALFADKGFIHARAARDITDAWSIELFAQKEFNKLILLKDRILAGSGLRYEIRSVDTSAANPQKMLFGLGSGLMYERELTTMPTNTKTLIRSTNYMSLTWKLDDRVSFLSTTYFQLALKRSSDFRLLNESSFSFLIAKTLSFLTAFNLRYDNEPPFDVKKYDLAVTNGLSVIF